MLVEELEGALAVDFMGSVEVLDSRPVPDSQTHVEAPHLGVLEGYPFVPPRRRLDVPARP